jgi:hypothetical protein
MDHRLNLLQRNMPNTCSDKMLTYDMADTFKMEALYFCLHSGLWMLPLHKITHNCHNQQAVQVHTTTRRKLPQRL